VCGKQLLGVKAHIRNSHPEHYSGGGRGRGRPRKVEVPPGDVVKVSCCWCGDMVAEVRGRQPKALN
jgi:hypothetical protein